MNLSGSALFEDIGVSYYQQTFAICQPNVSVSILADMSVRGQQLGVYVWVITAPSINVSI